MESELGEWPPLQAAHLIFCPCQHWALLVLAVVNLLLSTACSLGLLLAVSLTVANGGRRLIADCHPGLLDPSIPLDQGPGHSDCPFDPTRIYVSVLSVFAVHKALICPFNHSNLPLLPCFLLVPGIYLLHLLGYSLGSLDPFFAHVCSRGCSIWLLLCGSTHPPWGWALQEGRATEAGKDDEQEGFNINWLC